MSKQWYVVQAYSSFEKNVQKALKERIAREGMEDYFGQILVPVEEVVDIKNGRKTVSERKFFPGYVLVEMEMTDASWHLVKSTPRVNGFIGGTANRPLPISQREVKAIMEQFGGVQGEKKPKPKTEFEVGQQVRLIMSAVNCVFLFRFLVGKRLLSWILVKWKKCKKAFGVLQHGIAQSKIVV